MMSTDKETDWAEKIGASAFECFRDMVAALECDYDRLDELRADRDIYEPDDERQADQLSRAAAWVEDNPDDAEELKELEEAAGECKDRDEAEQRIHEDALSVEVRTGWYVPGQRDADTAPAEFQILLTTGGPAVRILGELDEHGEPHRAWLEVQDWFKPWTEFYPRGESGNAADILLAYARCFCFAS